MTPTASFIHRLKSAGRFTSLCLIAASLGACAGQTPVAPENYDAKLRASAEIVRLPQIFDIAALASGSDFTPAFNDAFDRFLIEAEARYGDRFWLDAGDGVTEEQRSKVKRAVLVRGLTFSGEAPLGPRPANGTVTLYLERYVATVPSCGEWAPEEPGQENNTSSFWGCGNTANLALMVADPRDLVAGSKGKASTDIAVTAITKSREAARGNAGQSSRLTSNSSSAGSN